MNTPLQPAPRRTRHVWRWVLGTCGVFMVVCALGAYNTLTLTREAAALRHELMNALPGKFATRVQLSVGEAAFALIRSGGYFMNLPPEARLGLQAVQRASVGVYQLEAGARPRDDHSWGQQADDSMARRGYTRMVGVEEKGQTVLVYTPVQENVDVLDLCLAVFDGEQLVVVSAKVRGKPLMQLIEGQRLANFGRREI
ncbi:MAG: hypothetical protein KA257_12345 [Opitutaceae bacterium]|nr:hypothetical protein [Opitutaceae bacterium]MBP9914011.1 hypothetical protein [Opitutaceae bacterium]